MMYNENLTLDSLDFDEFDQEPEDYTSEEQFPDSLADSGHQEDLAPDTSEDNNYNSSNEQGEELTVLEQILREKGISDLDKIKFTDDNGGIQERKWEDLSAEEQYNILKTPVHNPNIDLDANEINLINEIRLKGITPQEYVEAIRRQGAESVPPEMPTYEIDDIPDDELFVLDLQTRSENMTDDELIQALDSAKANPESYKKLIAGIREEYRKLEEDEIQLNRAMAQAEQQELFALFQNNILYNIDNLNSIGDLDIELSNEDKNELALFILGRDGAGVSFLGKALNDGETLTRMAWFALHGEDTFNEIQDYFADLITRARLAGYQEGLAARNKQKAPEVFVKKPNSINEQITDISQLD